MGKIKSKFTEFLLTSAAVRNHKTVYLILAMIIIGGISSYLSMPREAFPEIEIPTVFVSVPYPGNSPEIIRDKIIRPLEQKLNKVNDIKKVKATAKQDFGLVIVEFDVGVSSDEARRRVEDAVAEAQADKEFARDLPTEPTVAKMDVKEIPIININMSGDFPVSFLKDKAEFLKDKLENVPEINEVNIRGVQDQKMKIEIRKHDAEDKGVSFRDIEGALRNDNLAIGAGSLLLDGVNHFVMIDGKFKSPEDISNLIVKHDPGKDIKLSEVADVRFGDVDVTSYARQNGDPVVMLDIKKRSGANIINAVDKAKAIVSAAIGKEIPSEVDIIYTNDFSTKIRSQVSNLENSIISGVLLVVGVLLFFLGLRNALFVGIAIPLSMFMSFILLHTSGVTLNIMVLFSLVMALGMLVDNGIVVIENIYRLMENEGMSRKKAAIFGVGEVAWPIIASTLTTLAAFVPLILWPGIIGEFMFYLPMTLIIVLGSSLFVALVINPVLAAYSMKLEDRVPQFNRAIKQFVAFVVLGILALFLHKIWVSNLFFIAAGFVILQAFVFYPLAKVFQERFLPRLEAFYRRFLEGVLKGYRPLWVVLGTFLLLVMSFVLFGFFPPKVAFFPQVEPNYFNIYIEHPIGTDIEITNETAKAVSGVVNEVLHTNGWDTVRYIKEVPVNDTLMRYDTIPFVETVIEQVGKGTGNEQAGPQFGETPNKAKVTVVFAEAAYRKDNHTNDVLQKVEMALRDWPYADVGITVGKEERGPPQEPPVNIELRGGRTYVDLVRIAEKIQHYFHVNEIEGAQEIRSNVKLNKPEIRIELDREYLRTLGMSTGQIASTIRTALFGKDVSTFDTGDDTYDINLRFGKAYRGDLDALLDQKIMFMNKRGMKLSIPVRSVVKKADISYNYSSLERLNMENVVTLFSDVQAGYNENEVIDKVKIAMADFMKTPEGQELLDEGVRYKFTGKLEQQNKEMDFLSRALLIAIFLILLILVTQFNSFSTPVIILSTVVLSLIGVFLGITIFRDDFVVMMTMIGIISLAGIVVNNAIVLVDYTNLLRKRRRGEKGMDEEEGEMLPFREIKTAIVTAGATRLRPVLLTAITTVLGLIPLAIGLNINFITLITQYDPQFFIGGDNTAFFGPMSWAIIYGLSFATFLTLVVLPAMYYLIVRLKARIYRKKMT